MENQTIVSAIDETNVRTPHYMEVWNWERYFNAAKSVLEIHEESKGDLTVIRKMDTSPKMIELSKLVCEELLNLAYTTITKITKISN